MLISKLSKPRINLELWLKGKDYESWFYFWHPKKLQV